MKTLTMLIALILWQGLVSDLGMETCRVVLTDDDELVAERHTVHIDAVGDQVEVWEKAGATEKSVFKAAMLDMAQHGTPAKTKPRVNPVRMLQELDRLLLP